MNFVFLPIFRPSDEKKINHPQDIWRISASYQGGGEISGWYPPDIQQPEYEFASGRRSVRDQIARTYNVLSIFHINSHVSIILALFSAPFAVLVRYTSTSPWKVGFTVAIAKSSIFCSLNKILNFRPVPRIGSYSVNPSGGYPPDHCSSSAFFLKKADGIRGSHSLYTDPLISSADIIRPDLQNSVL